MEVMVGHIKGFERGEQEDEDEGKDGSEPFASLTSHHHHLDVV